MTDTQGHLDPSQSGILLDALRDVVGPQLYRANAFRVSGLSVATEDAEMYSQLRKLEMHAKLGCTAPQDQMGVLPLQPPPDSDAIRNASRRLHDMQSRLLDEFLWFWPLSGDGGEDGDAGLESLRRGDISGAHKYWSGIAGDQHDGFKASHNLAVLHHALALDIECVIESQTDQLGSGIQTLREEHWRTALRFWLSTVTDEALWGHVASRAEALDDPRLTSGFIRRLRQFLPEMISSISVDLAVRAAKCGDAAQAKGHMTYIRESGFDPELIDRRLDREARAFYDQIQRICSTVPARCQSAPAEAHRLAEGVLKDSRTLLVGMRAILAEEHPLWQKASGCVGTTVMNCMAAYRDTIAEQSALVPATADQLAKDVLDQSRGLLSATDAIFDESHPLRQAVSDFIAGTVRECMIEYGNETEDWANCTPVLEQASSVAVGDELRSQLRRDIDQAKENHKGKENAEVVRLVNQAVQEAKDGKQNRARQTLRQALTKCRDPELSERISGLIQQVDTAKRNVLRQRVSGGLMDLFARFVGLAAVVGVLGLIGWAVDSCGSNHSPSPATRSSSKYTSQRAATSASSYASLSGRIDSGKARVRVLETEIGQIDSQLEQLSMSIDRHKRGIEAYERLTRSGQRPNESAYRSTLESHNRLVGQHNSLLGDRNAKFDEYQREIRSVNDMVARYNRGER